MNQGDLSVKRKDYPFKWVLPLQHMAKVKIVQVLWRSSVGESEWTDWTYPDVDPTMGCDYYKPMCESLNKKVDALLFPEAIKDELKIFVREMIVVALQWIRFTVGDEGVDDMEPNHAAMNSYFIANFYWFNSGLVDGRRMLQSYVKNKDTIDFYTWQLLCDYCIEDDIIRFTETIDWTNCQRFKCSYPNCLYWYWRIYGKLPTKEMFTSNIQYSRFEREYYSNGPLDEHTLEKMLMEKMLDSSTKIYSSSCGIETFKYFQNERKFEIRFEKFFERTLHKPSDLLAYVIEQKDAEWLNEMCCLFRVSDGLFKFSVGWPWVMFNARWMNILEGTAVRPVHIYEIVRSMCAKFRVREDKVVFKKILYQSFKELWTMFRRKFGLDNKEVSSILRDIYQTMDITFCQIFFDDLEPSWRIYVLKTLRDVPGIWNVRSFYNDDFCTKFSDEVLKSDEEKEMFSEILSHHRRFCQDKN